MRAGPRLPAGALASRAGPPRGAAGYQRRFRRQIPPPIPRPMNPILLRRAWLCAAGCLVLAAPAHAAAQGTLAFGETVEGELTTSDPTLGDDSHYDLWRFEGTAGQRVVVTLRSPDFDAFLAVGPTAGDGCDACKLDDDGAGGTDSRVRMTLPRTGTYEIRANSLGSGETGRYTLTLEDAGIAPPLRARGEIRPGQTVAGELDAGDPEARDGSYFELWTFRGRAGDRIVVTLRSEDFDAYLGWGRLAGAEWTEIESDDDGAGGTDSRLEVTLDESGVYHISAGSLFDGETGSYTLTVERG